MSKLEKLKKIYTRSAGTPGFKDEILIAPKSFFVAGGVKSPKQFPDPAKDTYADITTRDAASPNSGDTCYVTAEKKFFEYNGTDWIEMSPGVILEDHEFEADKGFIKISNTPDRRSFETEHPDADDVSGQINMFKFSLPVIDQENLELADILMAEECVILLPRRKGQLPIQLGSGDEGVILKQVGSAAGSGKDLDYTGLDFEAKAFSANTILYGGAIKDMP